MFDFSGNFETLLISGFASDLKIIIVAPNQIEEEINAHKIFLQAGSPILDSEIRKNGDRLVFEHEEPEIVKLMLKRLYSIELYFDGKILTTFKLLQLAKKYEVKSLIQDCEWVLENKEINKEEALPLFQEAMYYRHIRTIDKTMECICSHGSFMLKSSDFFNLSLDCLNEIIEKDELVVKKEMEVFDAVYRWGKVECYRQSLDANDPATMRTILAKVLPHVRFPLMEKDEFEQKVMTKDLLSERDVLELTTNMVSYSFAKRSSFQIGRFKAIPRTRGNMIEKMQNIFNSAKMSSAFSRYDLLEFLVSLVLVIFSCIYLLEKLRV